MAMGNLEQYDVFLNHRGPDLKKTFISHLYAALRRVGRVPFMDGKSLIKGQHAFNSINEALIGVLVHVAIFSPGYAESKYSLNELCDMLKSQKPLIPVFYNVDPENLRWTEVGPFAQAFCEHLKKGRNEDVVKWKVALLEVAAITGFRLVDCNNDTVKLEEKIVAAVLDHLPSPPSIAPARHPVGLKESSAHVIDMLHKMGENVGVMGICGVGGIGKTTLAREVYNQEQSKFGSQCFLKDVKDTKGVAFMDLEMKMVTDLLHMDAKKIHWDHARWFEKIQKQKVFLVIDNINERKQFDELIPDLKELVPGSRVLITSRDRDILQDIMLDVTEHALYEVSELSFLDSLDLFTWCAFRRNNIDALDVSFYVFAKEITKACCGLPLALEVMGGFLADKKNLPDDEKYWKEAILALRKNEDIFKKLRISYDGLVHDDDKRMFVDIACFMLGQPKRVALEVWDSIGNYGSPSWSLRRLIYKCLVKVDSDGLLSMHDLLRDMGRTVVKERALYKPEMQSHIWDPSAASKILQKKEDSNELLALSVVGVDPHIACKAKQFAKMAELKYLVLDKLDNCIVKGNFSGWSKELRWLQWRYFPHRELPRSLKLQNLVVLDLANSPHLTHLWARKKIKQLLHQKFPCKELRMLILNNCTQLKELPQHINKLLKLKFVNLEGCSSLKSLPDSLGELSELEYLNLSRCYYLTSLPDSMVKLSKLRELLMLECCGLKKLPTQFGRLKNLAVFEVTGRLNGGFEGTYLRRYTSSNLECFGKSVALEELPDSFGQLESLKEVNFGTCSVQNLCENFGCLWNLRKLNLIDCENLTKLPDSFSNLCNLEELYLSRCWLLQKLPPSVCGLKKLRVLWMSKTALDELPENFGQLESLIEVDFEHCTQLQYLCENFGCLGKLQKLNLECCTSLMKLPDSFSDLSNLEELRLGWCKLLQKLPPSIWRLKKLRVLRMAESALAELPEDFGQLQSLTEADFFWCQSFTKLPISYSNLCNLEELSLSWCELLQKLPPSICGLKKLRVLRMESTALEELPKDFGQLQSLTKVDFSGCHQLQNLTENFGCLGSLRELNLSSCVSLTKLPDSFSKLSNLENLNLSNCGMLLMFPPSMEQLKKLTTLDMTRNMTLTFNMIKTIQIMKASSRLLVLGSQQF